MRKLLNLFKESNDELLMRKFRVLVREKREMINKGDMNGYAHAVVQAELVARKIISSRIK